MAANGKISASSIAARPLSVGEERAPAPAKESRTSDHHSGSIRNTWVDAISILPLPRLAKLRPSGPP